MELGKVLADRIAGELTSDGELDHDSSTNALIRRYRSRELLVRSVRLQGRVIGLTMFSYEAKIDLRVPPAATEEVTYEIELVDLFGQAVGLIPARGAARRPTSCHRALTIRIRRGRVRALGVRTVRTCRRRHNHRALISPLARLASHRLPANRWKRGTRFGVVGLGAGLTITFTLSAFGILFRLQACG